MCSAIVPLSEVTITSDNGREGRANKPEMLESRNSSKIPQRWYRERGREEERMAVGKKNDDSKPERTTDEETSIKCQAK